MLWWCLAALLLLCGVLFLWEQSTHLQVTRTRIPCPVEKPLRILHLSDLHQKAFGKNNRRLLALAAAQKPDLVCFTGDLVNRHLRGNMAAALALMEGLAALCPTVAVFGNHEVDGGQLGSLEPELEKRGVRVLLNERCTLELAGQPVSILGLQPYREPAQTIRALVSELGTAPGLRLLLVHDPALFIKGEAAFWQTPAHLTLAGHTHGGQIRLPVFGALVCPGQGLFPKYAAGHFRRQDRSLVVSRGLGRAPRVFDRPEAAVLELLPEIKEI